MANRSHFCSTNPLWFQAAPQLTMQNLPLEDLSVLSPQMPLSLPLFSDDFLPDVDLLWNDEAEGLSPPIHHNEGPLQPADDNHHEANEGFVVPSRAPPLPSGAGCEVGAAPPSAGSSDEPGRDPSPPLRGVGIGKSAVGIGKPATTTGRRNEKWLPGVSKHRKKRTVLIKPPPKPARRFQPVRTASASSSQEKSSEFIFDANSTSPLDKCDGLGLGKPPYDVPRMSPSCLINQHREEPTPQVLLSKAIEGVCTDVFERSSLPVDDYTNLEEFSLCKNSLPGHLPYTVATSSLEGAAICKDIWGAQHSQHLCQVLMKPPNGPSSSTQTIIEHPSSDQLDEARKKLEAGFAAAPRGCQGLPQQCANWVEPPTIPFPKRRSDFSLLTRNIGAMRRSGYMHICTSTQLTTINSLPGSLAVKYLVLMATLLGQPILGQAAAIDATNSPTPLPRSANPQPLLTWHQETKFHQKLFSMDTTEVRFLFNYFPAIQITMPTSNRRLLRVDRIVDLAPLSALQHNSLRWTKLAMSNEQAITSDGFRLIGGQGSSVEYLLHSQKVSATSCAALAKAKHGRLPLSKLEVSFATDAVTWPEMIWTQPTQNSIKTSSTSFTYELQLEDLQLLPSDPEAAFPCKIWHMVRGQAKQVQDDQIGSEYIWFQNTGTGQYHVYNPWHLSASVSTNGSCAVFVPHDSGTITPARFLHRCLVLRNGSLAEVHRRQLHSAVALQRTRLEAVQGLPSEMRLQNVDHSLGPLSTSTIRLVQPLKSGKEQLVLGANQQALKIGRRRAALTLQDFRPLQAPDHVDPLPTPSALIALGSTLLSTAGSFVIQSATQEVLAKAMQRILAGGKYKFLDPMLLQNALISPDRTSYLSSFNRQPDQPYSWDEDQNILLLRDLQVLGHIPAHVAEDEAQLASGLAIVSGAAQTLEHFDKGGLRQLEKVALNFLASSDLKIDTKQGGLVYVVRSGSVALASYFLSTIDTTPSLQTHRLHALPAYQGKMKGSTVSLDLPKTFTLTHQATDLNSSAAQSSCAKAIASQEYHAALGREHPACFTVISTQPMMQIIYTQGSTRLVQTASPPGEPMVAFLACAGQPAHRFMLKAEINVFMVPGTCRMDFTIMDSKLAGIERLTSEAGGTQFLWMLSYNTSAYGYKLSTQEEAYVALYSVIGALTICGLVLSAALFKFRHLVPCFKRDPPPLATSTTYRNLGPLITHPHLNARSLSDFSSSNESVEQTVRPDAGPEPFCHVRPSSLRTRPPFSSYTATVRKGKKTNAAVVHSDHIRPASDVVKVTTDMESAI